MQGLISIPVTDYIGLTDYLSKISKYQGHPLQPPLLWYLLFFNMEDCFGYFNIRHTASMNNRLETLVDALILIHTSEYHVMLVLIVMLITIKNTYLLKPISKIQ